MKRKLTQIRLYNHTKHGVVDRLEFIPINFLGQGINDSCYLAQFRDCGYIELLTYQEILEIERLAEQLFYTEGSKVVTIDLVAGTVSMRARRAS